MCIDDIFQNGGVEVKLPVNSHSSYVATITLKAATLTELPADVSSIPVGLFIKFIYGPIIIA